MVFEEGGREKIVVIKEVRKREEPSDSNGKALRGACREKKKTERKKENIRRAQR